MAGIDRSSALPLWAQVLDDLRCRLAAGEFTERFPTDAELTIHYDVSRHTAREAMRHLKEEGIVSRERGRGTFVRSEEIEQNTGALYSLFRSLEERGISQESEVLELDEVVDAGVAERFSLPPSTPFVRLERVRLADGTPLAHDVAWIPSSVGSALVGVDFTRTALYDELRASSGVAPRSGHERVRTDLPTAAEAELLAIDVDQPIFRIERRSRDGDQMIEWRRTALRGDRYAFVAQWSPDHGYETTLAGDAD